MALAIVIQRAKGKGGRKEEKDGIVKGVPTMERGLFEPGINEFKQSKLLDVL